MSIHLIQKLVGEHFGFRVAQLTSHRRNARQAYARHVAMYLARSLTQSSYPEIAMRFNVDHTTVLHAFRRIERMLTTDAQTVIDVDVLKAKLAATTTNEPPKPLAEHCPHCGQFWIAPERRKEMTAEVREQIQQALARIEMLEKVA